MHPYLRRRNGEEEVSYLHPAPASGRSEKTLGVPLFQEQLMHIAIDVAGFDAEEADQLRQAMGSEAFDAAHAQRLRAASLSRDVRERGVDT